MRRVLLCNQGIRLGPILLSLSFMNPVSVWGGSCIQATCVDSSGNYYQCPCDSTGAAPKPVRTTITPDYGAIERARKARREREERLKRAEQFKKEEQRIREQKKARRRREKREREKKERERLKKEFLHDKEDLQQLLKIEGDLQADLKKQNDGLFLKSSSDELLPAIVGRHIPGMVLHKPRLPDRPVPPRRFSKGDVDLLDMDTACKILADNALLWQVMNSYKPLPSKVRVIKDAVVAEIEALEGKKGIHDACPRPVRQRMAQRSLLDEESYVSYALFEISFLSGKAGIDRLIPSGLKKTDGKDSTRISQSSKSAWDWAVEMKKKGVQKINNLLPDVARELMATSFSPQGGFNR